MNINYKAISELRFGLTGDALADHELRSIARQLNQGAYKSASAADRAQYENGLLRYALRKVCGLLDEAVADPEPTPDMTDVRAAEAAQDWRVTEAIERAAAHRAAMGVAA